MQKFDKIYNESFIGINLAQHYIFENLVNITSSIGTVPCFKPKKSATIKFHTNSTS